jgi:hypothetical protein
MKMKLKVGDEVTLLTDYKRIPAGTRVRLTEYSPILKRWRVRVEGEWIDALVKRSDLSDTFSVKAEEAPCSSQLRIDRELLKELYSKGSSDVKEALRTKYPGLFGPIKTERIVRGKSLNQLADITMANRDHGQLLIGVVLAPNGYEHKCVYLSGTGLQFKLLNDRTVTVVQK